MVVSKVICRVSFHETYFTSLFINTLQHLQKCLHDTVFIAHETPTEIGLNCIQLLQLLFIKNRVTSHKTRFPTNFATI